MKKSLCDEGNSYHCLYKTVFLVKTVLAEVLIGKTASQCKLKKFGAFWPVHNCDPFQLKSPCLSLCTHLTS